MLKWGEGFCLAIYSVLLPYFRIGGGGGDGLGDGLGEGASQVTATTAGGVMVYGLVGGGMIASSVSWFELQRRQG
jgi:hypothetical protein